MKKLSILLVTALVAISLVACQSTSDTTIHVYTRDSSSGTREAFESAIGLDGNLSDTASEVSSNGDMATRVGQDESGIGYASLTTDFATNNIKALSLEGVEASSETVLSGDYLMQRPFMYVTRAEGDYESDEKEELIAAFIAFMTESIEGLTIVQENGGIVDLTNARSWEEIAAEYPVLNNDNSSITIRTGGSTSVETILSACLEAFQPLAGNVGYAISQTGSGDAVTRTLGSEKDGANAIDIGFTSREFNTDEDISEAMAYGEICRDAVVIIVNASNSIDDITIAEAYAIFSGSVTTWSSEE